jgi:hypothetical protein
VAGAVAPVADLVGPLGDGVADPVPTQPGADRPGAVALSPITWDGRTRVRPGPTRGTRICAVTAVNWVQSLVFPPVHQAR